MELKENNLNLENSQSPRAEAAERPRVKKRRRAVAAEGAQLPEQLAALPDAQLW